MEYKYVILEEQVPLKRLQREQESRRDTVLQIAWHSWLPGLWHHSCYKNIHTAWLVMAPVLQCLAVVSAGT